MKLVTFNVRCSWSGDGINSFPHRAGGIVSRICADRPDMICFQECTDKIFGLLQAALPDYVMVFNQRNADRRGEGLATALRRDSVSLLGLDSFWLSPTPNLPGSRYEEQSSCPRICQCVTARYGDSLFRVYNIHLDHRSDSARRLGMEATLRRVKEDLDRDPLPFFILGDFNALPGSAPIALCEDNPCAKLTELTAELDHTFHDYGRLGAPYKIDYIFADPDTAAKVASVTHWLDESDGIYLSDHYPIAADVEL